jgi:hypothetical protein
VHYNNQGLFGSLDSGKCGPALCLHVSSSLPLERTMGFFKMWWLGEVSNLPQGPREAPPTPSMTFFLK